MSIYGSTNDKRKIKSARDRLADIYLSIPETKGCMENNALAEGGCGAWCCKTQTPQVLYSEFLNSWHHISKEWSDESFLSLVERCLRKYLFPNNDKGCVFIDKQNNICLQHETRPFNCRIYGITPEEEFTPRYERLKVIYPDARNQCNLVSTVNGKKVTTHDTEKWWNEINAVEMSIGIKKETINDSPGGSYRTYHDHILIHLLGDSGMEYLGNLRSNGSNNEKEHTIRRVLNSLKKFKESQKNDKLSSKNESTETSENNRE